MCRVLQVWEHGEWGSSRSRVDSWRPLPPAAPQSCMVFLLTHCHSLNGYAEWEGKCTPLEHGGHIAVLKHSPLYTLTAWAWLDFFRYLWERPFVLLMCFMIAQPHFNHTSNRILEHQEKSLSYRITCLLPHKINPGFEFLLQFSFDEHFYSALDEKVIIAFTIQ